MGMAEFSRVPIKDGKRCCCGRFMTMQNPQGGEDEPELPHVINDTIHEEMVDLKPGYNFCGSIIQHELRDLQKRYDDKSAEMIIQVLRYESRHDLDPERKKIWQDLKDAVCLDRVESPSLNIQHLHDEIARLKERNARQAEHIKKDPAAFLSSLNSFMRNVDTDMIEDLRGRLAKEIRAKRAERRGHLRNFNLASEAFQQRKGLEKLLAAKETTALLDENEIKALRTKIGTRDRLLREFVDMMDEDCRLDHNDFCQSHGTADPCFIEQAKNLYKKK